MTFPETRQADERDLDAIAICHSKAFPRSLSSALGRDYLKVMLNWYLTSDNTFLFYISSEDRCVGYCGGMIKTVWGVGSASSMAQHSFNAGVAAFIRRPWLLFHKEVRAKYKFILKNVLNRFFSGKKLNRPPDVAFEPYAGLVVIGVHPDFQGKGHGSLLLREFERIVRQKGLTKMALSVRTENQQAISAYLKNGWVVKNVNGSSTSMEKEILK